MGEFVERGACRRFEIIGRIVADPKLWVANRPRAGALVADAELFRHRSGTPTRHAARCALENSKTFLSDANSIMIPTDPTGLIIDTRAMTVIDAGRRPPEHGDAGARPTLHQRYRAVIVKSKPVQTTARSIFARGQRWTCAAVPAHDH